MAFPTEAGAPAMETLYAILDNGSLYTTSWEVGQPGTPSLPSPGRVVTEEEYRAELDVIQAAADVRHAEQHAQEQAAKKTTYDALRELGMPDAPAQKLSGYRPPE